MAKYHDYNHLPPEDESGRGDSDGPLREAQESVARLCRPYKVRPRPDWDGAERSSSEPEPYSSDNSDIDFDGIVDYALGAGN
jgi:hypothetical protein